MNVDMIVQVLEYIISAVGGCAVLSAALNKNYENKWLNGLMKLINFIGANTFKAKNAK
ncbi:MAG: hypothetical protein ACTSP4_00885 [Candidatus Hodarchaeales archaeon]